MNNSISKIQSKQTENQIGEVSESRGCSGGLGVMWRAKKEVGVIMEGAQKKTLY